MLAETLAHELAVALGLGTLRFAWRIVWPHLRAWARDHAYDEGDR